MPHVFDAALGTTNADPSSTTIALTTSAAAASGTLIVVGASWFGGVGAPSVAGGGLTWTVDKTAANGNDRVLIASAYAASGLASGSTITPTWGGGVSASGRFISAVSFTGSQVLDTGRVDITGSATTGAGATWTAGPITTANADDLIFAIGLDDGSATTTTPTVTWSEIDDANNATSGETWETVYQIVVSATSWTAGGTFLSGGTVSAGAAVAYKAAVGGAAATVFPHTFTAIPFQAQGRNL